MQHDNRPSKLRKTQLKFKSETLFHQKSKDELTFVHVHVHNYLNYICHDENTFHTNLLTLILIETTTITNKAQKFHNQIFDSHKTFFLFPVLPVLFPVRFHRPKLINYHHRF